MNELPIKKNYRTRKHWAQDISDYTWTVSSIMVIWVIHKKDQRDLAQPFNFRWVFQLKHTHTYTHKHDCVQSLTNHYYIYQYRNEIWFDLIIRNIPRLTTHFLWQKWTLFNILTFIRGRRRQMGLSYCFHSVFFLVVF